MICITRETEQTWKLGTWKCASYMSSLLPINGVLQESTEKGINVEIVLVGAQLYFLVSLIL